MGLHEDAFRARCGDPIRLWRIVGVRGATSAEIPTGQRIWRDLQVPADIAGDPGVATLARIQSGVVHRTQLTAVGLGRGAVAHRVATGRLHRLLPAVYAVGHVALGLRGRLIAALLQGGHDCVLSHGAAALLWGLIESESGPAVIAITVAGRRVRTPPGLAVHRVLTLATRDVRIRHGLPVTSPARTLLDLAADSPDDICADALATGRRVRLVSDGEIQDVLARHPRRTGAARLRRLHAAEHGAVITRSRAEREFRRLVRDAGLPAPEVNATVVGLEVDFLWRPERLVVEMDGYAFHSSRRRWERDRLRDQRLLAAGYRVLRVTWGQLVSAPVALAVRIGQALTAAAAP